MWWVSFGRRCAFLYNTRHHGMYFLCDGHMDYDDGAKEEDKR